MILPATAERTGGFCMPCRPFSSLTAEEREEFNATMKKPLVSFTFSYNAANAALNSGNNVEAIEAYDSAIEEWEKAKKGNDDSIPQEIVAMCLSNRGTALTKQGRADEALRSFDRALEVRPRFLMALFNKAWLLERIERFDEAIAAWETYIQLAKDNPRERDSVVQAYEHLLHLKGDRQLSRSSGASAAVSQSEAGGFFLFNWDTSKGAAAMSIDLLSAISPNNSACPRHFRNAFFEVRFCSLGNNPEMDQRTFDEVKNARPCLRTGISDAETRLLEGSTDELGFIGHLLAVWSDSAGALPFIHQALSDTPDNGYLGWIPLVGVNPIEQFHAVARELELAFDTGVNVGTYLSTRPWRSFPEGTLERLGFTKSEK